MRRLVGECGPVGPKHEPLPDGCWWACHEPERRVEMNRCWWKRGCPACLISLQASLARGEDREVDGWTVTFEDEGLTEFAKEYVHHVIERWYEPA